MNIKTKFNYDDIVYAVLKKEKPVYEQCTFCEGEGSVLSPKSKESRICPKCEGKAMSQLKENIVEWNVVEGKIGTISAVVDWSGTKVTYSVHVNEEKWKKFSSTFLFKKWQDAEEYAKKLNVKERGAQ